MSLETKPSVRLVSNWCSTRLASNWCSTGLHKTSNLTLKSKKLLLFDKGDNCSHLSWQQIPFSLLASFLILFTQDHWRLAWAVILYKLIRFTMKFSVLLEGRGKSSVSQIWRWVNWAFAPLLCCEIKETDSFWSFVNDFAFMGLSHLNLSVT